MIRLGALGDVVRTLPTVAGLRERFPTAELTWMVEAKAAGVHMEVRLGATIDRGQPLLYVHAETASELSYALDYASRAGDIVKVEP